MSAGMRQHDAGFSLIEALVALVVLGVAGVTILSAVEAHARRIGALETRAVALLVAENHLAELTIGAAPLAEGITDVTMLDRRWTISQTLRETDDPALVEATLSVKAVTGQGGTAILTGFIDREGGQ